MNEGIPPEATEVTEHDILFECGACGKSLVVEERGAGLLVQCTDCGETLRVPERDAQDSVLAEDGETPASGSPAADGSGGAIETALLAARQRIAQMEEELESLCLRRNELETLRVSNLSLHTRIWEEVVQIGDAAARIEDLLGQTDVSPPATRQ